MSAVPETGAAPLVLVVDDETPIARVVADLIEDLGLRALTAPDGRQALALARTSWPDLVITDMMMPGMGGIELIATLRAEAAAQGLPPLPIILMTAAGGRSARTSEADVFLAKPFDLAHLEELIMRLVGMDGQPPAPGAASG